MSLLSVEGCILFVMREVPTLREVELASELQRSVLRSTNGALAWMNVMAWRLRTDSTFQREALPVANRMYHRPGPEGVGLANVLLCGALAAPAARTILRTALIIARPQYPVHIGSSLPTACDWLAARSADAGLRVDSDRLARGVMAHLSQSIRPVVRSK